MNKFIFTILFLLTSLLATAQNPNIFASWDFNNGSPLNMGWETDSLPDGSGSLLPSWNWTSDGTAQDLFYWENGSPIGSDSKGGAIVFNSALLIDEFGVDTAHVGQIALQNFVQCPLGPVYLKFNNYYRNFESRTYVDIITATSTNTVEVNTRINQNVETGRRDYTVLDITPFASDKNIKLRFRFEGSYYFWLIDDVELWSEKPYEETFPTYLGDSLRSYGIPYLVDSLRGAYKVREEIVGQEIFFNEEMAVQFKPTETEAQRDSTRDEFKAIRIDSCMCNQLELWEFGDHLIFGNDTLSRKGFSTGAEERTAKGNAGSGIDGAGLNHFIFDELKAPSSIIIPVLDDANPFGVNAPDLKIAILDTGVDYLHTGLNNHIYYESLEYFNGADDDSSCYADDPFGWNFIDNHNNPMDDHSHGTHVSGIVKNNISPSNTCTYGILPVKIMNDEGWGTVFTGTCGIYYSLAKGANLINGSWSHYGLSSSVLSNSLDTAKAKQVLYVASAGNDSVSLDLDPAYPASFDKPNVISIAAHNSDPSPMLSVYSNFSSTLVDFSASGDDIISYYPGNSTGPKSGTSMAAPAVTAAAAVAFCDGYQTDSLMISQLSGCSSMGIINGGLVLDLDCILVVPEIFDWPTIKVFPNPVQGKFYISFGELDLKDLKLSISDIYGRFVYKERLGYSSKNRIIEIKTEHFPSGFYVLTIEAADFQQTFKLIMK